MAAMAYPYPYPYAYPYGRPSSTTFLEETYSDPAAHHHGMPMPCWSHKLAEWLHEGNGEMHKPKADVRETMSGFYIDIEVPGINDKADLKLKWLSSGTLLVSCDLRRKKINENRTNGDANGFNGGAHPEVIGKKAASSSQGDVTDGDAEGAVAVSGAAARNENREHHNSPHLTINERNIGHNSRAFHFPVEVEREKMKATLSAGLLTLEVPKKHHEQVLDHEVEIQC
jgi:HSP20 family molecular chaperone IbpA